MDRYQFEDSISDYLENSLSLKERKEFEKYLLENPGSREKVEAVRKTIRVVNGLQSVQPGTNFIQNLEKRLKTETVKLPVLASTGKRTYFGMEPLYATLTALTLAGMLVVGSLLFTSSSNPGTGVPLGASVNPATPQIQNSNGNVGDGGNPVYAENVEQDTTYSGMDSTRELSPDIQNRIRYVKNPR